MSVRKPPNRFPTDDPAHHDLRGRNRETELGHAEHRHRGGQRDHERAGDRVHGAQLAQAVRGARTADDGAEHAEHRADHGGRGELDHPAADRGPEDVRGVVRAQRPAQEQPARQEN
jgi:hypothetical protein